MKIKVPSDFNFGNFDYFLKDQVENRRKKLELAKKIYIQLSTTIWFDLLELMDLFVLNDYLAHEVSPGVEIRWIFFEPQEGTDLRKIVEEGWKVDSGLQRSFKREESKTVYRLLQSHRLLETWGVFEVLSETKKAQFDTNPRIYRQALERELSFDFMKSIEVSIKRQQPAHLPGIQFIGSRRHIVGTGKNGEKTLGYRLIKLESAIRNWFLPPAQMHLITSKHVESAVRSIFRVMLLESMENIFDHAYGPVDQLNPRDNTALIGIRRYPYLKKLDVHKIVKMERNRLLPPFFVRLLIDASQKRYHLLEIAVIDGGRGFRGTLGENREYGSISEADLIKEAFKLGITTKTGRERLRILGDGLYKIQRIIVEGWHGVISVRSGETRVFFGYDPGDPRCDEPEYASNEDQDNLPYFPGVQYRLLLPLYAQADQVEGLAHRLGRLESGISSKTMSATVDEFVFQQTLVGGGLKPGIARRAERPIANLSSIAKIVDVLDLKRTAQLYLPRGKTILFLDFKRVFPSMLVKRGIQSDVDEHILEMLKVQNRGIVFINMEDEVFRIYRDKSMLLPLFRKIHRLLPIVNERLHVYWEGVEAKERLLLEKMWEATSLPSAHKIRRVTERNPWFFIRKGGVYDLLLTREAVGQESRKFLSKYLGQKLKGSIREDMHLMIDREHHGQKVMLFSQLLEDDEFVSVISKEIYKHTFKERIDVILTSSLPVFRVGEELAKYIRQNGKEVRVAISHPFEVPTTRLALQNIRSGEKVLILADISRTGTRLERLIKMVKRRRGDPVSTWSIVLTNEALKKRISHLMLHPLATFRVDNKGECRLCRQDVKLIQIDEFTEEFTLVNGEKEETLLYPQERSLLSKKEFWSMLYSTKSALTATARTHFEFNGLHYDFFIDTDRIFQSSFCLDRIVRTIVRAYQYGRREFDVVIYPPNTSAMRLARALGREWGKRTTAAIRDSEHGTYLIAERETANLKKSRNVLVVDDGVNFGNTIISLSYVVKKITGQDPDCCVFVNRIYGIAERILYEKLGERFKYLYRLPYPRVYRPRDCPFCRREGIRLKRLGG